MLHVELGRLCAFDKEEIGAQFWLKDVVELQLFGLVLELGERGASLVFVGLHEIEVVAQMVDQFLNLSQVVTRSALIELL